MSDPVELEWAEPPERQHGRPGLDYAAIVIALKIHPGKWARVVRGSPQSPATKLRGLGCEVRTTQAKDDEGKIIKSRFDIFARWPAPKGTGAK